MAKIEWETLCVLAGCYGFWLFGVAVLAQWSLWAGAPMVAVAVCLHSSLRHEAIHGHPTRLAWVNHVLVLPALDLAVPYGRFRDTHLAHHHDADLTDPYDDPESNYLDPAVWAGLAAPWRAILRINNTIAGRMVFGPALGLASFWRSDLALLRTGASGVAVAWAWHGVRVALVVLALTLLGAMPWWAYGLSVYLTPSLLKLRTFLEHRAHDLSRARTAIVEDCGPLAFLFLNNNLHAVHHMHPQVPCYDLPARYRDGRARFLASNQHYVYPSYGAVLLRYFWRVKDPVAHPLYPWRS